VSRVSHPILHMLDMNLWRQLIALVLTIKHINQEKIHGNNKLITRKQTDSSEEACKKHTNVTNYRKTLL